ncbi:MAG: C39 family peptidase [Anaerolineaceae bacterium]
MKNLLLREKLLFLIFLSFSIVLSACNLHLSSQQPATPTLSMEEQVVGTLTALQSMFTQTPTVSNQADAEQNAYSIEITQEVLQETPIIANDSSGQELPVEYHIYNILGHHQYFAIGCEASAAMDWAAFFGITINEFNFQYQLPQSDNPDLGFVGSVEGPWGQVPPYAYGVHAEPVAKVLREKYGMNALGVKGFTLEQLKAEIAANRPVIAWVIGNCVGGVPYEYTDSQGNITTVAAYEHVVIITGYTNETIRYMNNGKFYDIPNEYFLNSWGVLGNMAVYLQSD